MDLGSAAQAITPTLDGPVLAVLAATAAPLSIGEVTGLLDRGSRKGVYNVLNRLADQGIVDVHAVGSVHGYMLNREHVAAPAAEAIANVWVVLFERIRAEIEEWSIQPVHAIMFGSAARRDGDTHSDIDILIVRRDTIDRVDVWETQTSDLAARIERWTGNHAHIVDFAQSELAGDRGRELIESVRADGVAIVDGFDGFVLGVDRLDEDGLA